MQLPQAFDVLFMADQTAALQIQREIMGGVAQQPSSTPTRAPKVRFGQRGHKLPINAPSSEQLYTILVQSFEELRLVTAALSRIGKTAYVDVMTQQGLRRVQLQDFLNQSGWS